MTFQDTDSISLEERRRQLNEDPPKLDPETEILRLAELDEIEYENERQSVAKALGWRVCSLDKMVARLRTTSDDGGRVQGQQVALREPKPWPDPIDGDDLLDAVVGTIKQHVVLHDHEALAVALWVIFTHAHECFQISPRLNISSPEKQCGKSTLLSVIEAMATRPLATSNATTPSVFRAIEMYRPTLLIDEADTFLGERDEMRGILNSGHNRASAHVIRTAGDEHEPRAFSTWAPVAIAGIGRIADTLEDRSVIVRLRRRLPGEAVQRLRLDRMEHLHEVASKIARWIHDNIPALKVADPDLPSELGDRAQDNWRPLISIADTAGKAWGRAAREAAVAISNPEGADDPGAPIMLLEDCWRIFEDKNKDRLQSSELVEALVGIEDRPWSEWRHGKPITASGIARLLKRYGITPCQMRFPSGASRKGYSKVSFEDAYKRYVPGPKQAQLAVSPVPNRNTETNGGNLPKTGTSQPKHDEQMFRLENARNPQKTAECFGVSVGNPEKGWVEKI